MKIGLIDVDSHNFPNLALMKISAYYKSKGHQVSWAQYMEHYDVVFASKIFTFSQADLNVFHCDKLITGGTGFDISKKLPKVIDNITGPDYSLYPQYDFSIQRFSIGCIRHCPFCLVREKEGLISPVEPMNIKPTGHIEVIDNNFFANPEWKKAIDLLISYKRPVKLHGVDVRTITEEQCFWLNQLKLKSAIHIAWDLPQLDLRQAITTMTKYIKPYKIVCYVLVGFNSTIEQDLFRLRFLKSVGVLPFVQPYRDYTNNRVVSQYERDLARWANRAWLFKSMDFLDYEPRRNFKCSQYLHANPSTY